MFAPTIKSYLAHLEKLKKERAEIGLPESVSLQLLIDEAKLVAGVK